MTQRAYGVRMHVGEAVVARVFTNGVTMTEWIEHVARVWGGTTECYYTYHMNRRADGTAVLDRVETTDEHS